MSRDYHSSILGCLLGTAVGDAVGLACEGYPRARQRRVFGEISGPRLLPGGRGMVSDDTEHTIIIAQALIASGGETERFAFVLASEMRRWFRALPAGLGMATLKACLKLAVGAGPQNSGVFSAGNGPAMRAAILGVYCGGQIEHLRALNRISSRITHTDDKAEAGALAVALAARHFAMCDVVDPTKYFEALQTALPDDVELLPLVQQALESARGGETPEAFAPALGLERGVSGYILHTVPVALQACFRYPDDMRGAVLGLVRCGGDTDSTAAIAGGIIGARVGKAGVPEDWLRALCEWPRDVAWMERLAARLDEVWSSRRPQEVLPVPFAAILLRNLGFWGIVWPHVLRRLLPPY
jgi:ADP-ribosylglycohydrolase